MAFDFRLDDFEPCDDRTPDRQLRDAMLDRGISPPDSIAFDGRIHRFPTSDKRGDDSGWYVAFGDSIPAASFGDFRSGAHGTWRSDLGRRLSLSEQVQLAETMRAAQKAAEELRASRESAAAESAAEIWGALPSCPSDHPYLLSHGIAPHGAKLDTMGRLVVPLYGSEGEIMSLQFIAPDGEKRFLKGGRSSGGSHWVGDPAKARRAVYVAEGFATACAIVEATGDPCLVAYSAHNLREGARMARERVPEGLEVVVVADHDGGGEGRRAAEQCGERWVMPPEAGQDACDYRQAGGDLVALLHPETRERAWLVSAAELMASAEPIRWIVKGWIPRESLVMLHGPSGVGKSFCSLDLSLRIASDLDQWQGSKVRHGSVAYLAGEGHAGLGSRIRAWFLEYGERACDLYVSKGGTALDTPEGLSLALAEIRQMKEPPILIVVDTLHRFLGGDENSAQDTARMLEACARLQAEFSSTVLLIHHPPKGGNEARGSSAWRGAVDAEIRLSRVEGQDPAYRLVRIENTKQKDGREAEDAFFELAQNIDLGWTDEDGESVTGCVARHAEAPKNAAQDPDGEHWKLFERAWWFGEAEWKDDRPYLSRSALREFLRVNLGCSETQIKNHLRNDPGRLIGSLLASETIEQDRHGAGWVVKCPGIVAALALSMRSE